jgi:hypothetical protein
VRSSEIESVGLIGPLSSVLALINVDTDFGEIGGDGVIPGIYIDRGENGLRGFDI